MNPVAEKQSSDSAGLLPLLETFASRVNGIRSLRAMLKDWRPEFFIQTADEAETFRIEFRDGQVEHVAKVGDEPGDGVLLLRGDGTILNSVFSGTLSPLKAYTDGALEVYGSQKDQIKLDAIALVVWGA